ncbi:MAG: hypothetical protein GX678_00575 [Actinomycetales bacterium]|nr:hypothetical protein [Actinomycetales bacterium]
MSPSKRLSFVPGGTPVLSFDVGVFARVVGDTVGGVVGAGAGDVETVGVGLAVGVDVAGDVRFDRSDDLLVDRSELSVVSWSGLWAHDERTTSSTSDKTGVKNVV